jgi:hypothetical protein
MSEEWTDRVVGRIRPGHHVRVINLSLSGALIETGHRLSPGGSAELQLEIGERRHITRARILRCYVSLLRADAVIFQSALAFEQCLPWMHDFDGLTSGVNVRAVPHATT